MFKILHFLIVPHIFILKNAPTLHNKIIIRQLLDDDFLYKRDWLQGYRAPINLLAFTNVMQWLLMFTLKAYGNELNEAQKWCKRYKVQRVSKIFSFFCKC